MQKAKQRGLKQVSAFMVLANFFLFPVMPPSLYADLPAVNLLGEIIPTIDPDSVQTGMPPQVGRSPIEDQGEWSWSANPLTVANPAPAMPQAEIIRLNVAARAAAVPALTTNQPAPPPVAVTVALEINSMSIQNDQLWVVGYRINSGAQKSASFNLNSSLDSMLLNDKDQLGNAFSADLRDIALDFFAGELLAKNGGSYSQSRLFALATQGLNYLPITGKNDLTKKTLDALISTAAGTFLNRTLINNAISAAARHYSHGANGNVQDFAVRDKAHRVPMSYFMHSTLTDSDNQTIINAMFNFYKDPSFFSSAMTSVSGGWRQVPEGSLLGYNLAVTATLTPHRLTLASQSAIRTYVINAWSSVFATANFSQKFKTAFPALQQEPWNEFDFDFFKSLALFAASSADVQKVITTFQNYGGGFNADQTYMFQNWGLLVVHGARTFSSAEISEIRSNMARYPAPVRNQIRMFSSSPEYISDGGPSYGRGGYSLPFNNAKEGLILIGKNQWGGSIGWTILHEVGHLIMDQLVPLATTDNLVLPKRTLHSQLFNLGAPEDRPSNGFQNCKPSPGCPDTSLPYANSDYFENMGEFAAGVVNDTAFNFNYWMDVALNENRFIGLRSLMLVLEVLAANNGGQVPFYPANVTAAGVNLPTVLDTHKNITRLSVPVLSNPPFNVPAEKMNKIYEFTYTSDHLHIAAITVRNLATGALIDIAANPLVPHETTAPTITLSPAANVTTHSARINFSFNESSYYQVEYSTSANFSNSVKMDWSSSRASNGSQTLSGLAQNTTYYARVKAQDAYGNLRISSAVNFKTLIPDTTAPAVTFGTVSNITTAGATINFSTNESAYYQIEYSTTSNFSGSVKTAWTTALSTNVSKAITGLNPNQTYYARIISKDTLGNQGTSAAIQFITLRDITPPVVSPPAISEVTRHSIQVNAIANEPSYFRIEYSTDSNFRNSIMAPSTAPLGTSYTGFLNDLRANTRYYVRIWAMDTTGNMTISSSAVFITLYY